MRRDVAGNATPPEGLLFDRKGTALSVPYRALFF
jgi:hypothetical protein